MSRRSILVFLVLVFLCSAAVAAAEPGTGVNGEGRVVGGDPAPIGKYPWMAALIDVDEHDRVGGFNCGGALIAPRVVLTAAHCMTLTGEDEPREMDVIVGATDLRTGQGERFDVTGITLHPAFAHRYALGGQPLGSDVALLHLDHASKAEPLSVISRGQGTLWAPGTTLTGIGYGFTHTAEGHIDGKLREVDLERVEDSRCGRRYNGLFNRKLMLCAGSGGHDTCNGDSGSPLLATAPSGKLYAVGIVNFGARRCGDPNHPGVYARLAAFGSFISQRSPEFSPVHRKLPRVIGRPIVSKTVRCAPGKWRGRNLHFKYLWGVRSTEKIKGAQTIAVFKSIGIEGRTLRVPHRLRGKQISCGVLAINKAGAVPERSKFVGPVTG